MTTFLSVIFALVSILLILIVLIQRGRGGGLVGAFGAGGGGSAFGTKTGDVFTSVTVVFFVLFLLLAIVLNWRVQGPITAAATTTAPAKKQPVSTTMPSAAGAHPTGIASTTAKTTSQTTAATVGPTLTPAKPHVKAPAGTAASGLNKTSSTTPAKQP